MKLLKFVSILIFIMFGASANALELEYGRYNVNAQPHADCIDTVCQIDFEKTYSTIPLAFFMSSVSFLNELDAPSAIKILEVTKTYVRFQQKIAPAESAVLPIKAVPMEVIDYVIIEKGIHDFNGVQVIADAISTKKYKYRKQVAAPGRDTRNIVEQVSFSSAYSSQGFTSFSAAPGVIHQVQTANNGEDFWLTSTVPEVTSDYLEMALERSEVDGDKAVSDRGYPTQAESIGFIAALGSGKRGDIRFEVKSQMTVATKENDDPVKVGCETYAEYGETYPMVPIMVASKNTREGTNGGWLRRCRLENNRASFMIDEDMDHDDERSHTAERIGYIIFEVPKSAQCAADFTHNGTANNNASHSTMEVWDGEKKLTMGIMLSPVSNTNLGEVTMGNFFSIDTGEDGTSVQYFFSLLEYDGFNHQTKSLIKSIDVTSQVVPDANNGFTLTATFDEELKTGKYYLLQVTGSTGASSDFHVISHTLVAGGYKVPYAITPELNLAGSIKGANPHTASVFFQFNDKSLLECDDCLPAVLDMSLSTKGGSCGKSAQQLTITPPTAEAPVGASIPITFEIKNSLDDVDLDFSGNLNITPTGNSDTCWKATADVAAPCIPDTSIMPISGGTATYYLYSSVKTKVDTVTAYVVGMDDIVSSAGPYQFVSPSFELNITPPSKTALVGQSIPITFTVVDNISNDSISWDPTYSGFLNITPTGGSNTCWKATSDVSASCISDTSKMPISGDNQTYYLFSDVLAEVGTVTAYVVGKDDIASSAGPYEFIKKGYVFDSDPLKIIAGKEVNLAMTAKRTTIAGTEIMDEYDGDKTLSIEDTSYFIPDSGLLNASLINNTVKFIDGRGTLTLKYNDAGQISVKIRDSSGDIEGDLDVESRPHQLALCAPSVKHAAKAHNGTSSSGPGFARAGETFTVTIKPTIYDASKADPCERATTPNFYSSSGRSALAELSHALDTPSGGKKGELTQEGNAYSTSNTYEFSSSTLAKDGITAEMNWNEVGSLKITVSNTNYGFGDSGGIGSHDIVIGRFYPYQFELDDTVKQGHDSFTYMGQEFTSAFTVTAQSVDKDGKKTTTTNYGDFDKSLLMPLKLVILDDEKDPDNNESNELGFSRFESSTGLFTLLTMLNRWDDGQVEISDDNKFKFIRRVSQASPRITQGDGPYKIRFGLEIDNHSVDCAVQGCTDFKDLETVRFDGTKKHSGRKFSTMLDMRYGRLELDDVNGNSGEIITIPLRVEYWDGTQFITNTDDNETAFNGANFCRKLLESNPIGQSKVKLSGQGQLTNGIAELTASQNASDSARKETVLLKLRMGVPAAGENGLDCEGNASDGLEFLHFNWSGEGDDNPSTIVTFGIYRGNDRVLFRGEPRAY